MFWENLDEKLVFTDLEVKTPEDIFEVLGGELTKLGYCKDTYVQALKDREKVFPTGVLAGEIGVAIPHTDPEHVANSAIAIANLKEPVTFHHMGTNPSEGVSVEVKFVIMLAIAGTNHLDMLQKAIQLIQDMNVLKNLTEAKDAKEVINIVKKKEEEDE